MLTLEEFLNLPDRMKDGYFAEHACGYKREKVPPDGAGEHGGSDYLEPPGGLPKGFTLPPKGPIHFAYMAPRFSRDEEKWTGLRIKMAGHGFRCIVEHGPGITVTFRRDRDGASASYSLTDGYKEPLCTLIAAVKALGIVSTAPPAGR